MWHILLVKGGKLQFNPEFRQDSRANEQAYEVGKETKKVAETPKNINS